MYGACGGCTARCGGCTAPVGDVRRLWGMHTACGGCTAPVEDVPPAVEDVRRLWRMYGPLWRLYGPLRRMYGACDGGVVTNTTGSLCSVTQSDAHQSALSSGLMHVSIVRVHPLVTESPLW
eukprot:gene12617-biopygen11187